MSNELNYKTNPLNGVSLKNLLVEIVEHYGFDILYAYMSINCFKTNPSVGSSIKFLKKTDWAREKVEAFYLYEYRNMPRASSEQFLLPPRDRIIPDGDVPGEPTELSLEAAEEQRESRALRWAAKGRGQGGRSGSGDRWGNQRDDGGDNRARNRYDKSSDDSSSDEGDSDPWGKWKS